MFNKKWLRYLFILLLIIYLFAICLYKPSVESCQVGPVIFNSELNLKAYPVKCLSTKWSLAIPYYGSQPSLVKTIYGYVIDDGVKVRPATETITEPFFTKEPLYYILDDMHIVDTIDYPNYHIYSFKKDEVFFEDITNLFLEKDQPKLFAFNENLLYFLDGKKLKTYSLKTKEITILEDFSYIPTENIRHSLYEPQLLMDNNGQNYFRFNVIDPVGNSIYCEYDLSSKILINNTNYFNKNITKTFKIVQQRGIKSIQEANDFGLNYKVNFFFDLLDLLQFNWPY